jgi:hypothetical protein
MDLGTRLITTDNKGLLAKIRPMHCMTRRKAMILWQHAIHPFVPQQFNVAIGEIGSSGEESDIHASIAYAANVVARCSMDYFNANSPVVPDELRQQVPKEARGKRTEEPYPNESARSSPGASC